LTVAGQFRWPNAQEEIRSAISRTGGESWIHLRAAYSQEEAVEMLQRSHVLIHLKYHDPCPTAVIEAMACAVPVLGSHSGGLPELLGDDGGVLLPIEQSWETRHYPEAGELADAVETIMTDWSARSAKARTQAERNFDHRAWVERHREIFEGLLVTKDGAR